MRPGRDNATGAVVWRLLGVGSWEHGGVELEDVEMEIMLGGKRVEHKQKQNKGDGFRGELWWCWEDWEVAVYSLWEEC